MRMSHPHWISPSTSSKIHVLNRCSGTELMISGPSFQGEVFVEFNHSLARAELRQKGSPWRKQLLVEFESHEAAKRTKAAASAKPQVAPKKRGRSEPPQLAITSGGQKEGCWGDA